MKLRNFQVQRYLQLCIMVAGLAYSNLGAWAQSADALIDKLVEKGILTAKEATELREESEKNFNQAYAVKSGMPEWVSSFKFNGDVRMRYEGFYSDTKLVDSGRTNSFTQRNRFRYRLRFSGTATMLDNLEAGFRLTSGEPTGAFGGNPISASQTLQDNGAKKAIWIDTVYGKWSPLNGPDWTGNITVGKMDNPLLLDDMIFDPTYTPEGLAVNLSYAINDRNSLKLNADAFVLDELQYSAADPALMAAQLRWDAVWSSKLSSTLGLAGMVLLNANQLTNSTVPNANVGNTRNADGTLKYDFNPIAVDGALTYTADSFPFYKGPFPVKVSGEYLINPAVPVKAKTDSVAYTSGITLGKSGKRGTWELSYAFRWLGADAWYEEFTDNDFGAVYQVLPSQFWGVSAPGFYPATGVKGHIVRFAYSPTDSLTLVVKWYLTDLINPSPAKSDSQMNRLEVDGNWKF